MDLVADTNLAPPEAPAQEAESPIGNFLKNSVCGIIMTNVISQWINTGTSLLCGTIFAYLWKTWHDQQAKKLVALQQKVKSDVHNREIKKNLDEADHVIDVPRKALDGSELKQIPNGIRNGEITAVEWSSPALPAKELGSLGGQRTAASALPGKEQSIGRQTTGDEGNSSAPPVEEESIGQVKTADEASCLALPAKELCKVTLIGVFPKEVTSLLLHPVKALLEGFGAQNVDIDVSDLHGSRILETSAHVKLDEVLLRKARNMVKEGAKIDKNFTLQIDSWGIYYNDHDHTTEGVVKLFKLQDNEVPTILSAEYAAGVLRIYGLHLKGAEIKAATSRKSKKLNLVTHEEIYGGNIDMLTSKDLLPEINLRNLYVYATKPVPTFEGERVINVMSSSVKIDDIHLKKLLRDWLPTTFIVIFVARQIWLSMKPLWNAASAFYSEVYWILPMLVIIFSTLLLPPWTEQWIGEQWGSLYFAVSRLKLYLGSLGCSGLDSQESQDVQESQVLTVKTKKLPQAPPRLRPPERTRTRDLSTDDEEEADSESESRSEETPGFAIERQGETILVTSLQWEWKSFDLLRGKDNKPVRKKRTRVQPESREVADPFSVIYENLSGAPWPDQVYVHIKSTALLEVVEKLLPNIKQTNISLSSDEVGIKGRVLFLARDKFKDELGPYTMKTDGDKLNSKLGRYTIRTDGGTPTRTDIQLQRQLNHLVGFLEKEYAETSIRHERMDRQGCVSWDMLWSFLVPGEEVVYKCSVSGEKVCGMVDKASYEKGRDKNDKEKGHLLVRLKVYDYNCKTFEPYANLDRQIFEFEGEIAFHTLGVYPLRFPGQPDLDDKHFLNQGSTFGELSTKAKCRYMHYTGIMFHAKEGQLGAGKPGQLVKEKLVKREKANGRVMIDLASFARMNPSYNNLGNAKPPYDIMHDNKVVEIDISEDPNRRFAPCIVYGFSFQLKKWGAFSVRGFDEIKYNVQAWDELVMDEELKRMTEVLVGDQLKPDNVRPTGLDTISSKGDGCIVLCYGPPGTGKTLTAEALADKYSTPLWAISVSELGITPDKLESQLVSIWDVAQSWHALLLLDEADIYLEKRSDGFNLVRNGMTGIFLRQLEYYKGVLFLTTNRAAVFDEAISSRITLFLHYKALHSGQREQIWRNFLKRAKIAADEIDEIVGKVSLYELNGRQIRNVIQNAQKLARSRKEGSTFGDLETETTTVPRNPTLCSALPPCTLSKDVYLPTLRGIEGVRWEFSACLMYAIHLSAVYALGSDF